MKAADLFRLPDTLPFGSFFSPEAPPWEWVRQIAPALAAFAWPEQEWPREGALHIEGPVFLHETVRLPRQATIIGPAYIGAGTEIRPGAYIRGNVIVGENCVLGNSCEFKNCLLMDRVQVPHFSYVGDSVLGSGAHLGAGAILSNLRLDQGEVPVVVEGGRVMSGLKKLGAMLGEKAEIGCNAVLQPGTVMGKRALVIPAIAYGGTLAAGQIAKGRASVSVIPRRD
jgi:UDP-N-acetylglucosamine diphosphorylase / glucose-1-phosphate thymidylyltransferase / UDP-N-acetylgalactosamine diphosphorylase / glucosamine-1-phosphate N-acetyltransferase / galactosamine-1-phosphate N-acetyltransferase